MTDSNKTYLDDLIVHLRLRGVPGHEIGEFLEEAKGHLAASGEQAEDAFGPVEDYASALAISKGRRATPEGWSRNEFLIAATHFVSWFFLVRGVTAWIMDEPGEVTVGMIIGLLLGLVLAATVIWPAMVRYATRRVGLALTLVATIGPVVLVALLVGLAGEFLWNDGVLLTMPAPTMVIASIALVVISIIPLIRRSDPIRRPKT